MCVCARICIICIYFSKLLVIAINWSQPNHSKQSCNTYTLERGPHLPFEQRPHTTLPSSCAIFYPTTQVRICSPYILHIHHLITTSLLFAKLMGEKCDCILFNVTFPWLLGEVDFNYTDNLLNHHHLLKSLPFPY